MPRRPRNHIIEESSRNQLRAIFSRIGWVVWDLQPDYGEDLLVRIFTDGNATHYSFFVQAKATDHIDRYMSKDKKYLNFPIDVEHLEHWNRFWEPVILTVWDSKSNTTYWEIIQDYLQANNLNEVTKKSIHIVIPTIKVLDENSLPDILSHTKSRFARFETMREGAELLINLLREEYGIVSSYKPGDEFLCIETPTVTKTFLFNEVYRRLEEEIVKSNLTHSEFMERMIRGAF
jgi:Domain of unknown function (DUF4365)